MEGLQWLIERGLQTVRFGEPTVGVTFHGQVYAVADILCIMADEMRKLSEGMDEIRGFNE